PDSWRTVRDKTNEFDREEILRRLQDRVRIEQAALAPGSFREWTYSGIPDDLNGPFQVRYRVYCEERQSYQSESHGVWGWEYYLPSPQNPGEMLPSMIYLVPNDKQMRIMTMQTSELEVYPKGAEKDADYFCARGFQTEGRNLKIFYAPYPGSNALMAKDGKATLRFLSLDKKGRMLYFMENDGPYLMVPVTGFADNYFRTILALFLQIMVFAAFGTAFAACFSLATGIFLTLAYLIWGLSTRFVLDVFTNTTVKPHTFLDYVNYYGGQYIDLVLLDPGAFAAQEMLSSGELVEYSYLAVLLFVEFGIKVLPFLLIGLWVYSKRELALAGKDR
ncbi:MAG: hypothetical protein J6Q65_05425, partial [Lentisphaeria bacterium]|nr:hypothetical protein [Lentisphaeria bacterium]